MKAISLTKAQRKEFAGFRQARQDILEVYEVVRKDKLPVYSTEDFILISQALDSQRFGRFAETQVCALLGLTQGRINTDPDGTCEDNKTYEIKASDASVSSAIHLVQYRPGSTDYIVLLVVFDDRVEIYSIPDKDALDLFSWGTAHSGGAELRVTVKVGSKPYSNMQQYLVKTFNRGDKMTAFSLKG